MVSCLNFRTVPSEIDIVQLPGAPGFDTNRWSPSGSQLLGKKEAVPGKERFSPVSVCSSETPLALSKYAKCLPSGESAIESITGPSKELGVS